MDNETRLQPPSVRELLTATLTERPRITLHELERAAALQGHSSIEVEIVLKSFLRDGLIEKVTGFQLRDPNSEVCDNDTELGAPRPVSSKVDLAESSREVAEQAIAKAAMSGPRPKLYPHTTREFWREALGVLNAMPVGGAHHLVHPDRRAIVLAKQVSVMLSNWRREKKLPWRFTCRVSDQGVRIFRIE